MNHQETNQRAPRSAWVRTAIIVGALAVPATWGVASASGGASPSLLPSPMQVPDTTTTTTVPSGVTFGPASFVGIQPVRVLDTRGAGQTVGVPAAAPIGANSTIDVQVAGLDEIPAEATSVAINVTIDFDATSKSFLTVWPTGEPRPLASTSNAEPGLIMANSALMKVGTDGNISVYNQSGAVNVIIDVTGYFVDNEPTDTTSTTSTTTSTTSTTEAP